MEGSALSLTGPKPEPWRFFILALPSFMSGKPKSVTFGLDMWANSWISPRGEQVLQNRPSMRDRQRVVPLAFDETRLAVRQPCGEGFDERVGEARVELAMPEPDG